MDGHYRVLLSFDKGINSSNFVQVPIPKTWCIAPPLSHNSGSSSIKKSCILRRLSEARIDMDEDLILKANVFHS